MAYHNSIASKYKDENPDGTEFICERTCLALDPVANYVDGFKPIITVLCGKYNLAQPCT